MPSNKAKWSAEFLGTFWLTLGGCGSAVLAAAFPGVGIGLLGVSLAFGLTVLTGAYALGPISGKAGFEGVGGFASNGFGANSPGGFSMMSVLVTEVVMTAIFLIVILGSTAKKAAGGFGGLAIGLCLTLIHLVSIPVSNTSVNPARSTGTNTSFLPFRNGALVGPTGVSMGRSSVGKSRSTS